MHPWSRVSDGVFSHVFFLSIWPSPKSLSSLVCIGLFPKRISIAIETKTDFSEVNSKFCLMWEENDDFARLNWWGWGSGGRWTHTLYIYIYIHTLYLYPYFLFTYNTFWINPLLLVVLVFKVFFYKAENICLAWTCNTIKSELLLHIYIYTLTHKKIEQLVYDRFSFGFWLFYCFCISCRWNCHWISGRMPPLNSSASSWTKPWAIKTGAELQKMGGNQQELLQKGTPNSLGTSVI